MVDKIWPSHVTGRGAAFVNNATLFYLISMRLNCVNVLRLCKFDNGTHGNNTPPSRKQDGCTGIRSIFITYFMQFRRCRFVLPVVLCAACIFLDV